MPPRPKQLELYAVAREPDAEEILFDGSIRGGKTQAGCDQIVAWAAKFGGSHAVMRKTYQELEDTTKKAMLRGDGGMPPALPPELVKREWPVNVPGGNKVELWNGGEILFRSLETPKTAEDKIKNITLCSFLIDQGEELEDDLYESQFYETLVGRLSDPRGPRKGIIIANPAAETHWIYRRFIDPETRRAGCRRVHVTLMDNAEVLDPQYVARMMARGENPATRDWFERLVLGKWGAMGGKRFKGFRDESHIVPAFDVPKEWEITEGGDYGWTHPFGWVWHACAPDGHEYFVAEHHKAKETISWHAAQIKAIRREFNLAPSSTWLDPSAWAQRGEFSAPAMELAEYGIDCGKAQNERLGGWNRLDELLNARVKECTCPVPRPGSPKLMLFDRCPELAKQIRNAKIKEGLDDVEKVNDDLLDPARYVVMSRPFFIEEEDSGAVADHRRRYVRQLMDRARETERPTLILGG